MVNDTAPNWFISYLTGHILEKHSPADQHEDNVQTEPTDRQNDEELVEIPTINLNLPQNPPTETIVDLNEQPDIQPQTNFTKRARKRQTNQSYVVTRSKRKRNV